MLWLCDMRNKRSSLATFSIIQFSASPTHAIYTHMHVYVPVEYRFAYFRNDSLGVVLRRVCERLHVQQNSVRASMITTILMSLDAMRARAHALTRAYLIMFWMCARAETNVACCVVIGLRPHIQSTHSIHGYIHHHPTHSTRQALAESL